MRYGERIAALWSESERYIMRFGRSRIRGFSIFSHMLLLQDSNTQ